MIRPLEKHKKTSPIAPPSNPLTLLRIIMLPPDLSPNHLASLIAVADYGSMSKAAQFRNLTQPSLSRQIQDLEKRLSVPLVERSATGAILTPSGEALVEQARHILQLLADIPNLVKKEQGHISGTVRLGTVDSIGISVLPPILKAFIAENPRVELQVVCNNSPELINRLLADELDIVISTIDHARLPSEILFNNRLVLVYLPDTPEQNIPTSLAEIAESRIVTFPQPLTVRRMLEEASEQAGLHIQPVMELANVEAIKAMVRAGLGFGIVPEEAMLLQQKELDLPFVYINDLKATRQIRMLSRQHNSSQAVERLMHCLRSLRSA